MNVSKTVINEIVDLLSPERLYAILEYSNSKGSVTDASIIGLHQESLSLSGNLMSILGVIEIALRNAVYKNLDAYSKTNKRLFQSSKPFEWLEYEEDQITNALKFIKRAKYDKMDSEQKSQLQRQAEKTETFQNAEKHEKRDIVCSPISVSDSDIVAKLMFSFWKTMYSYKYDEMLWHKTLKNTFPDVKNIHKSIIKHLETINKTRNRLAHHEPVLNDKFHATIGAIQFIAKNLNQPAPNPNSPLAKLLANDIKKITKQAEKLHTMMNRPTNP